MEKDKLYEKVRIIDRGGVAHEGFAKVRKDKSVAYIYDSHEIIIKDGRKKVFGRNLIATVYQPASMTILKPEINEDSQDT